jgi:hypothetical protein
MCRDTAPPESGTMDGLRGKSAPGIVVDGWRCRARGSGSGADSSCSSFSLSVHASPMLSPLIEACSSSGGVCERVGGGIP